MEILSLLLFFIFSMIILGILVYVSPKLSAFIMIIIPVGFVYLIPTESIDFLLLIQFSYSGIDIYNLHILLLIWSAFFGIISYAEILTWYLLREQRPVIKKDIPVSKDKIDTLWFKIKDFSQKLFKILKGEKVKR